VADRKREIRLGTDEADAVLAILAKREQQIAIEASDWQRLFASEGYKRLAKREQEMKVPIDESEFREFVLSEDLLALRVGLRESLDQYASLDLSTLSLKTISYLPPDAVLQGTIYPVIKPKPNSFVFELSTDPAMFMAMKPGERADRLENTLVHELHHWGIASLDSSPGDPDDAAPEDRPLAFARYVLSAFGEGFAMLAAAGSPSIHPHAVSDPEERERWDASMQGFDQDLELLEGFLTDVLDGQFETQQALFEGAMEFFGIQGPWYTVGWKMAQTVETRLGREILFDCMRDPRQLLHRFNETTSGTGTWSEELLRRLE